MSQKHYRETAEIIRRSLPDAGLYPESAPAMLMQARTIAEGLATMFAVDNGMFDRTKFLEAAGLGQ